MAHEVVMRAASRAAEWHREQRRKDHAKTPYINHLLEVASLLATATGDSDPSRIVAGLLHDSIEDAGVTRQMVAEEFGEDVAQMVWEVTDDKNLPKLERKRLQVEHAPLHSRRVQWLKLADKISNLRSLRDDPPEGWDESRKLEYVEWASQVVERLREPHPGLLARFWELAGELRARAEY